jgi:hypothetical protein
VLALVRTIYAQPTREAGKAATVQVPERREPTVPKAAKMVRCAEDDILAYLSFPLGAPHLPCGEPGSWSPGSLFGVHVSWYRKRGTVSSISTSGPRQGLSSESKPAASPRDTARPSGPL